MLKPGQTFAGASGVLREVVASEAILTHVAVAVYLQGAITDLTQNVRVTNVGPDDAANDDALII